MSHNPKQRNTIMTDPENSGLEARLLQAGATGLDFASAGNNSKYVNLIKEAAIYKYEVGESIGTFGKDWRPASGKLPFGYLSEDGITIHPEDGDSTDFKGHNGNNVFSWSSGGYWTIGFTGLESKKEIVETYFDATAGSDGSLTIDHVECNKFAQYVIAGVTQSNNLLLLHAPKCKVNEREDVSWKISDLMNFGITLKTYKDLTDSPYFMKMYGFHMDIAA